MNSKITICIPIHLKDRTSIAAALQAKFGAEYVFMGRVFQSTTTRDSCEIEICDRSTALVEKNNLRDSSLAEHFALGGEDRLDSSTLEAIASCPQIVYLTSSHNGYAACLEIARLAWVLLTIGGVAIAVESTGIAHSRQKWLTNYNSDDVFEIYSLFVQLIEGEDYYYSCGMHSFGKADVAISLTEDIGLAIYVMNVFNYYRLTESPILQDGHTFRPDMSCPSYQIQWIEDTEERSDSPIYNPFGRWLLALNLSQILP